VSNLEKKQYLAYSTVVKFCPPLEYVTVSTRVPSEFVGNDRGVCPEAYFVVVSVVTVWEMVLMTSMTVAVARVLIVGK
jgi:hypothetical protein